MVASPQLVYLRPMRPDVETQGTRCSFDHRIKPLCQLGKNEKDATDDVLNGQFAEIAYELC